MAGDYERVVALLELHGRAYGSIDPRLVEMNCRDALRLLKQMKERIDLDNSCAACSATLEPASEPPRCCYCLPNDEQTEAWQAARERLGVR